MPKSVHLNPFGQRIIKLPEAKAMIMAYESGMAVSAMAAKFHRPNGSIFRILKKYGVTGRRRKAFTAEQKAETLPKGMKRCTRCAVVKDVKADFYQLRGKPFSFCKPCAIEYGKKANQRNSKARTIRLKRAAVNAYGGRCACCGEDRIEFLTLDHIKGGGCKHRKRLGRAGANFYRWLQLRGFPKGPYQVMCFNCNWARGVYGTCPHERERTEQKEKS